MLQSLWLSMLFQELTMLKNKLKTNIYLDNLLRQAMNLQPVSNQYFIFSKSEIWSLSLMEHSKG